MRWLAIVGGILTTILLPQYLAAEPAAIAPVIAPAAGEKLPVWMAPPASNNGQSFRDLFERPDEWQSTRSLITGVYYADHLLQHQFTDEELRAWLPRLREWSLRFGLEVGAVKEWGKTGAATFNIENPMWLRFERLGGHIDAIAMDEPFCCVRQQLKLPDSYAVEQTAQFIALVRKEHPGYEIGDIEPYPYFTVKEIAAWLDALNARLLQMRVRPLDFFRLDPDWMAGNCSWTEVKWLQSECKRDNLRFSLIYWAADYPALKGHHLASEATWYTSVMRQALNYSSIGGTPDEYMIESWLDTPTAVVPDNAGYTFTQSVRDFCRPLLTATRANANDSLVTHVPGVIYGRKSGMALTMDVYKPAQPSGIGVLALASGGWHSWPEAGLPNPKEFLKHGQTVFVVLHSSAPRFTVSEISDDIARAVRYVRTHAAEYGVDPNRIGITGMSSGAQLSLLTAARGGPGDPNAKDPVDRVSSALDAVACYCPPSDFVNYGAPGVNSFTVEPNKHSWPTFGVHSGDPAELAAAARAASPITYLSKAMPPTLILHGDADPLVPLQQSQELIQRLADLGVPHQLVVRQGAGHGWPDMDKDDVLLADWFDRYLGKK